MIHALIFDKDGIVVDTPRIQWEANKKCLAEAGLTMAKEDFEIILGRHPADFIPLLEKKYNRTIKIDSRHFNELYFNTIKLVFPYMRDFILDLKKRGLKIGLTTAANIRDTEFILEKFHLTLLFDAIVTFEEYQKRKPDPEGYILTAKKLKLPAQNCLVFEDTALGMLAAKKSGMKVVVVPTIYSKNQDFSQADHVISNLKEFKMEWLK